MSNLPSAPSATPTWAHLMVVWWWDILPTRMRQVSKGLSVLWTDGVYLVAWPRVAASAPPIAVLLGVLIGTFEWGGTTVFTQSGLALSLAIILGFVGAQLGLLFATGYLLARLITIETPGYSSALFDLTSLRVAVVVATVGLCGLAAVVPLLVRLLRASLAQMPRLVDPIRFQAELVIGGVFAAVLSLLQLQALPMFVRPIFVWQGVTPPVASIVPVQENSWIFVLIALVSGIGRVIAEYVAAAFDSAAIERRLWVMENITGPSWWECRSLSFRLGLGAAAGTLILSGLLMNWLEALLLFTGQVMIGGARELLSRRLPVWANLTERLPVALRLVLAVIMSYFIMSSVLADRMYGLSFAPLIWALLAALACVALLFPAIRPAAPLIHGEGKN